MHLMSQFIGKGEEKLDKMGQKRNAKRQCKQRSDEVAGIAITVARVCELEAAMSYFAAQCRRHSFASRKNPYECIFGTMSPLETACTAKRKMLS